MKKIRLLLVALFFTVHFILPAQGVDYTCSWLGSTTGTTPWMQNFINQIQVDPDGTVYTTCGWDEGSGGPRNGTYKDGKVLANHSRNINSKKITDKSGHVWTIMNAPGDNYPTGNDTIKCDDGRVITSVDGPTGMAIANDGLLMISEFGKRAQVHFYNVSGTGAPVLDHSFGVNQGYLAGDTMGLSGDLRFRELTGCGMDAAGNIYVSMSSFFGGCELRSFTPDGKKNWELKGLMFVDNGDVDPATDGKDIYTKSHHFVWDSTKPAGQEWIDKSYTLNRYKYPGDARLNTVTRNPTVTTHPSATWIRYVDGEKIMVINDMFSEQLRMYRYDQVNGEIAIPSLFYARWNLLPFIGNIRDFQINNNPVVLATKFNQRLGTSPGTTEVGGIQPGQWLAFDSIDFGNVDTSTFVANYSCVDPWPACRIEIHADAADGRIIGNLQTARTGSNDVFKLFTTKLSDTITGIHRVVLVFRHPTPDKWPATQPVLGKWLWSDTNGNGVMDADEYQGTGVNDETTKSFWVDKAMNIWMLSKTSITKVPFTGLGANGNPTYNISAAIIIPTPPDFVLPGQYDRGVLEYDSDNDIMYLLSGDGDGITGSVAKYSNWNAGNRTPDWKTSIGGSQSLSIAGDYVFTIHGKNCKVFIYSIANGKFIGKMDPAGPIGWIDIPYGVRAFKRSNGEYVVLSEEDSKGKLLIYRFSKIIPNQLPVVNITKPTANQEWLSASNLITAIASDPDGSIVKVQIFIDSVKVSDVRTYTWLNATPGDHYIFARAFDNNGDSTSSPVIKVKIITTGLDPVSSKDAIKIYPNPAKDKVYVEVTDRMKGIVDISIIDSRGKAVWKKKASLINGGLSEIDVSGVLNGIYILKVTSGNLTENLKLVINK
jgi:hypothetical protein